ncbi:hypothetical protein CHS0354_003443 [Potamilus streckersoni]|uniref:Uncharacterized protein n=1 Tax=Potamilus streckersoni TaxID=2493646 RepID=A0AAE0SPH7_9BIVA|nr:hypothetical protein CHS0354_003443 [Potamilus streckersoni]
MVSGNEMSSCSEFIQNAWRKDLCVNCQRPRGEHIGIETAHNHVSSEDKEIDSPKPIKRNSLVTRPWANVQSQKEDEEDEETKWNSMCLPELNYNSVTQDFSTEAKEFNGVSDTSLVRQGSSSAILKNKISKKSEKVCVQFLESDPVIIGTDGGYENFFPDDLDPEVDGQDMKEEIIFTEEEKEFLLQALHNTLWNMENLVEGKNKKITISKEFEDIQLQSLWKPDRFSHVHEPEVVPQQYGTFPLRAKSSKSNFDNVFVDHPKLSPLPEIQEFGEVVGSKENLRGSSSEINNFKDLIEMKGNERKEPVSEPRVEVENNYDDPWEQRFGLDDSEMNLLEEIRGEIDLDSSSAGMAIVDLLNDILAKYSTGTPSDTDSVKNLDNLSDSFDEKLEENPPNKQKHHEAAEPLAKSSKEKSELEAKMVTLAASLRKNRGKRYAPRPPSCPPPPEPTVSPTKQIRAAQSTEPNFKMVPVGRPITGSPPIKPSPTEEKKQEKYESTESMEAFKLKNDKEKQPKKGITSFFRNILRRGRDSETDLCTSTETLVSNASSSSELSEQENKNSLERRNSGSDKRNSSSKSSPQLKLKVLPSVTRPLSPKPLVERTPSYPLFTEEDKITVEDKKEKEISPPQDTTSSNATYKTKDANQVSPTKSSTDSSSPSKTKEASTGNSDIMPRRPRDTPNVPPPKPPVALKPKSSQPIQGKTSDGSENKVPPSPPKEGPSRNNLSDDDRISRETRRQIEQEAVRKRAKSPKRTAAPTGPLRSSLPPKSSDHETSSTVMSKSTDARISIGPKGVDPKTSSFAKELEMKLSKGDQTKGSELKRPPAPPHPPQPPSPTSKSAAKEEIEKFPIQSDDKINSEGTETEKLDSLNKPVEKIERPVEKIELPKPTGSRKSFLGKLNRKSRPPPPPSVKRTKSITESSIHGETPHLKKIDVRDISGPVLITDMSSNKVVNRRNTISLGDDSSFLSGGSTSSGSATDKSEMSPRGSLDNLYELITDKAPDPPHMYDPPVEANTQSRLTPPVSNVPVEGYLEPVRSASMAEPPAALSQSVISVSEDNENADEDADAKEFEPVDEERRQILASQPIYEEINGYNKDDTCCLFSSRSLKVSTSISQMDENGDASNIQPPQSPGVVSISSESDVSSASNTLTRPRPVPRRRARKLDGSGFEQYVAMNRPSVAVALNEDQLREILSKLTAMNMQSLREIYTHHEKVLMKECLHLGAAGPLKWQDFDIYGKPIHTSERCVVYNAKMRLGVPPCQVMLLHTRPDMTSANHPSILKPTCIFSDSIPFSYLTDDFIKTSQLLENCVYQSNVAKCYVAVGLFDITESVTDYLAVLEAKVQNQKDFLEKTLFVILQLLSAISHCVEQGHHIAESDFRDIFLISNAKCSGDIVSFLPQQRSQDNQQIESVCIFIENFLDDILTKFEKEHLPSLDPSMDFILNGMQTIILLLQNRNLECLVNVRSFTEFILWGPRYNDLFYAGEDRQSSIEPRLSMWLEHKRSEIIHSFAKRGVIKGAACYINDFYCMKFLLKSNAMSLSESIRVNAYF